MDVTLVSAAPFVQDDDYLAASGRDLVMPFFMNRHRINDSHEHISFEFFGTSASRGFVQGEEEISESIRWFTKAELDDLAYGIPKAIIRYAKATLDAVHA